ncbi:MAG: hypothetical protein QM756_08985 [Polyangiaceae bacterium]
MKVSGFSGTHAIARPESKHPDHAARPSAPPSESPAASARISSPGRLFSQLSQLAEQDPAKFKEVAQQIADDLRESASQLEGHEAAFDTRLAERFEQAAQTGDMSAFAPRKSGGSEHPHHHPHHGVGNETRSVLEHALDMVHEALNAPPTSTSAPGDAAAATDVSATASATDSETTPSAASGT